MKYGKSFLLITGKTILFLLLQFMLVSCKKSRNHIVNNLPLPSPLEPATEIFKVVGAKIMDDKGVEFIAKGTNINGPYWPWSRPTLPDVNLIADVWKCNMVRLNCVQEFSSWNAHNADMDGIVKAFTDKKVVVMIEEHQFTGKYPSPAQLPALIAWWVAVANKYKNNQYVWFNIMNEPGESGDAPSEWLSSHEEVIKAIRKAGAPNIIVCDEHGFGQANGYKNAAGSGVLTYGPQLVSKYTNIMFSLHLYGNWVYGEERLRNYIDAVHAKNLAVIMGEYGAGNDVSMEVATSVFKVGIQKKIGRIAWHWAGDDIHDLVAGGNGGGFNINNTSGAKPTNLSFVGNQVWMDNHNQLTVTDPALTPPPVIFFNNDFEAGDPANGAKLENGWINFGTAYIDNTTANVKQGMYSVKIKDGEQGGCGQPLYLMPGATYRMTAWGKNSTTATAASTIGVKYSTVFGGAETTAAILDFTENNFQSKSVTFSLPTVIAGIFLFIYKNDATPAFWVDDIVIEKL